MASAALGLSGIHHDPTGFDDLYSAEPTERSPRDPMAGEAVTIRATTWPVEPGQNVWVSWTRNGADQPPVGAAWDHNSGNNSYWRAELGTFERGDTIAYSVHAHDGGGGRKSTGTHSFTVTSWSTVTDVVDCTDNLTSVDVTTGDSAGDFTPRVRFAFPAPDRFRVQIAPAGEGLDIAGRPGHTVKDEGDAIVISTTELTLRIQKRPYRLSVIRDGRVVLRQYDPARFRNLGWASDGRGTITRIEDHLLTPEGERFEGFGERYDRLDQRGTDVHHYVYNQYRDQGAHRRTYLSVPFFLNSAGYGVLLNTDRYAVFNLCTHLPDLAGFTVNTSGGRDSTLDYHVFTGTPERILDACTGETGRPDPPPRWAFGPWMSANEWNTQDEVENQLALAVRHRVPHTVLVLEQWSDEATFYLWHGASYTPRDGGEPIGYGDLTFPPGTAWRDPKAMVAAAHAQGVRVVLWQIPVLKENFDRNPSAPPPQHLNDKEHARAQGYVVRRSGGEPYRIPRGQWFGDSMVPDFTNPAAARWWMGKRAYLLDEVGIDGFKTDGGEAVFGRGLEFADGRRGDVMHNSYPNAYTRVYGEHARARGGVVLSRAGTAGAQAHSVFWAGDQDSGFGAFREAVRAGLSAGMSGVPFWTWDLAGFTGGFPSAELYLRAAAQAVFSPIMQYHSEKADPGASEARTPWNVAARTGDDSVLPVFRRFANVRMNLVPYLYSEAARSARTGMPMMRAMSLAFPGDDAFPGDGAGAGRDQQYLLGENLLVAPVTTAGATVRELRVPAGEWTDLWNGGRFTGPGTKAYGADLATIPVYARPGAILPLNLDAAGELGGAVGNSVTEPVNLVFRVYPAVTPSSYEYVEDEGGASRTVTAVADWARHEVSVTVPDVTCEVQVACTRPDAAGDLRECATREELTAAREGWWWDPAQRLTHVKPGGRRALVLTGVHKAPYEAEHAELTGTGTNSDHPGHTGSGFADRFDAPGDAVTFAVNADAAGPHRLVFRYGNAGPDATRSVRVDGRPAGTVRLPRLRDWDTWADAALETELTAGPHTVTLEYGRGDAGAVNLDSLTLARP
ncbi:TIM-barrel domain-containing protein [Bailinhaonella thermotolerans]|uniref:Carbohydrate-binding protein n=1 Tax=Bailinhaonella thermotolerans TaxID=1070861 RepID=A0A3A4BE79_9ACTN|nr:TIM-barrel domain-containing protein [Bailinhaonella thermotolerans]RJL32600.1 carbohydrate-binding protein [Bailinhaonella thermotolerans]